MPSEGGASSTPRRSYWIETLVITGSFAFADDDSGEGDDTSLVAARIC